MEPIVLRDGQLSYGAVYSCLAVGVLCLVGQIFSPTLQAWFPLLRSLPPLFVIAIIAFAVVVGRSEETWTLSQSGLTLDVRRIWGTQHKDWPVDALDSIQIHYVEGGRDDRPTNYIYVHLKSGKKMRLPGNSSWSTAWATKRRMEELLGWALDVGDEVDSEFDPRTAHTSAIVSKLIDTQ